MSNVGNNVGIRTNIADNDAPVAATTASTSSQAPIALSSATLRGSAALAGVAAGTSEIAFGARGDGARAIQTALKQLGVLSGAADGIFGRQTQTAVATFQRQNGLPASGSVDQATLAKLDQKLAARPSSGSATTVTTAPANVDRSVVFLGMGDHAKDEVAHLKGRTAVTGITDTAKNDEVSLKVGSQTKKYDLTKQAGCDAYVRDLGLTGAKASEVSRIIFNAGDDARDETAQLAKVFHEAQQGKRQIERLVISGHSVGGGVWGDNNGYFELKTLGDLAKAFPTASRQVEDFMVAGCYSGGESAMEKFRGIFPNLKTSWAYTGSAPGTWSGAMPHLSRWEQGTRGHDSSTLKRESAANTRKGENVAVWTAAKGYDDGRPMRPLADVRRDIQTRGAAFDAFFKGDRAVEDTQAGPIRDYYNSIQAMLQHPQLPAAERPALERARDQVIRLNFYDATIKGKFQAAHKTKIDAGFRAVGLPAPDFSQLSRKDALAKIAEFERKLAGMTIKPAAANTLKPLLTDGLRDLKPSQIPNTWV